MKTAEYNPVQGVSALYQDADNTHARKIGLTRVSEEALDLGPRASMPHRWSVENSPVTNGEKHYNRLINSTTYLGTFAASLVGAYFFKHTKTGVKLLDPAIKHLQDEWKVSKKTADTAVTIGSLMAGGTVPAIPFKLLEDTRVDRIKAYNEKHGTGIDDPELREMAKERIEQIPKQSNSSAALGRLSAMGLTLAFGIFLPTAGKIEQWQKGVAEALPKYNLSLGKLAVNYSEKTKGLRNPERMKMKYKQDIKGAEEFTAAKRHRLRGLDIDEYIVTDGTWSAFTSVVLIGASRLGAALMGDNEPAPSKPRPQVEALQPEGMIASKSLHAERV